MIQRGVLIVLIVLASVVFVILGVLMTSCSWRCCAEKDTVVDLEPGRPRNQKKCCGVSWKGMNAKRQRLTSVFIKSSSSRANKKHFNDTEMQLGDSMMQKFPPPGASSTRLAHLSSEESSKEASLIEEEENQLRREKLETMNKLYEAAKKRDSLAIVNSQLGKLSSDNEPKISL